MADESYSNGAAWMGGKIMPIAEAAIPVTDWGLTHSDITYDVVHVWDGRFFRMDDYLDRFERSLIKCRLSVEQGRQDMRRILHQIVARSGLDRSYVSLVASRGQPSIPAVATHVCVKTISMPGACPLSGCFWKRWYSAVLI